MKIRKNTYIAIIIVLLVLLAALLCAVHLYYVRHADECLYRSKESGRNRVTERSGS